VGAVASWKHGTVVRDDRRHFIVLLPIDCLAGNRGDGLPDVEAQQMQEILDFLRFEELCRDRLPTDPKKYNSGFVSVAIVS